MNKIKNALINTFLTILMAAVTGYIIINASPEELQRVFRFNSTIYLLCLVIATLVVLSAETGEQMKKLNVILEDYRNSLAKKNELIDSLESSTKILEERNTILQEIREIHDEKIQLMNTHIKNITELQSKHERVNMIDTREKKMLLNIIDAKTTDERNDAVKEYEIFVKESFTEMEDIAKSINSI